LIFFENKSLKIAMVMLLGLFFAGCTGGRSEGGVYKSVDSGASFEQKSKIDEKNSLANESVLSLKVDPNNPNIIYAGTLKSGIFQSVDGAEVWVRDTNNFTNVTNIVISPVNSEIIYISAKKDGRGKILKTENGGGDWEEIYTENANGPYVITMSVDHSDSNVLYFGDSVGGVFKTDNGGESWKTLFWAQSSVNAVAVDQVNPNILYFGTATTGAMVSENGGEDFDIILQSGTVYNIVTDPSVEGVVYLSDKEGLKKSTNKGKKIDEEASEDERWEILNTLVKPDILGARGLAINPQNNQEIFYASSKAFYRSMNGGVNWTPTQLDIGSFSIKVIEVDPLNPQNIYLGLYKNASINLFP
jgi:photosystem II stability/assembly factor-like uncharacterized protein